jgi:hypothetical protein
MAQVTIHQLLECFLRSVAQSRMSGDASSAEGAMKIWLMMMLISAIIAASNYKVWRRIDKSPA